MSRLPNLPMWVNPPVHRHPFVVHWRWPYNVPTECGRSSGASTISSDRVTCLDCLAALGIRVDNRTPEQRESDRAGALWRSLTGAVVEHLVPLDAEEPK